MFEIKDSEVPISKLPVCICPYRIRDEYMLVELNTGLYIGSIRTITSTYPKLEQAIDQYTKNDFTYPLLQNYLIYHD